MPIRYRHHPDPDLSPGAPVREGEVENVAELEALVMLGSLGPQDDVALDGKRFKKASRVSELREPLEQRYGEQSGPLATALFYAAAALIAVIAGAVVLTIASKLLKLALFVAIVLGAIALWRALSRRTGRTKRKPRAD